jgi:hypothetical protein
MSRRTSVVVVVAIAAWAFVAWLASGSVDEPPRDDPDPRRDATPASSLAPPAPPVGEGVPAAPLEPFDLHGVVRERGGAPVPNALVYLVGKDAAESDALGRISRTDDQGRWSLFLREVRGLWIGAWSEQHPPVFADGDSIVDVSKPVVLELERGAEIVVTVLDDAGRPVEGAEIRVRTPDVGVPAELPAPGQPASVDRSSTTGVDGHARLRVGSREPVEVTATAWPDSVEPSAVRLEGGGGAARFRTRPSCVLDLRVVDAETGLDVPGWTIDLKDEDHNLVSLSKGTRRDGSSELRGLHPGTFRATVHAPARVPWKSPAIAFAAFGDRVALDARLERNAWVGNLVLEVDADPLPTWPKTLTLPTPFRVLVRKEGAGSYWRECHMESWDAPTRRLRLDDLPVGRYDVLVWNGPTRTVGLARLAVVEGGADAVSPLRMRRGTEFAVPDVAPVSGEGREMEVSSVELARLPFVMSRGEETGQPYLFGGGKPAEAVGPYPFPVTLVAVHPDGTRREIPLAPK